MKDFFSIVGLKINSLDNLQQSTRQPEFMIDLSIKNPFLKVGGFYVADPFVYILNNTEYLFCELLLKEGKGVIARLERKTDSKWVNPIIVVNENFHLSYPTIHNYEDKIYMLVESADNSDVRLYKARNNNLCSWKYCKTLLKGKYYDPTIFKHGNNWFMFACTQRDFSKLELFYSENGLLGNWEKHPKSPLNNNASSSSRPAGPVLNYKSKKFRLAQDCSLRYGQSVKAFEIKKLTPNEYIEEKAKIILTNSNQGWNSHGMHHFQIYKHTQDGIYAVSDGYTKI